MQPETPTPRSLLAKIFISPNEKRLRSGWRIALHGLLFINLLLLFSLPFVLLYLIPDAWLRPLLGDLVNNRDLLVGAPPQLLAIFLSVYLARRFIDRRSFASLGMAWEVSAGRDLVAGIVISAPMMAVIFIIQWMLGWLQIDSFAWQTQSVPSILLQTLFLFGIFVLVGFSEELIFRGYWQINLTEGLNFQWAAVISSLAFGIAHAFNAGFNFPALIGLTLAGFFFLFSVRRSGSLWLAIGLHIGWNFFEGPIFGFQVSGLKAFRLLEHQIQGPEIWTGGTFGPEAGLVLLPGLLLGALLIALYTHARQPAGDTGSHPL
jgi:membrane protease YdiL (CAAX protease family)